MHGVVLSFGAGEMRLRAFRTSVETGIVGECPGARLGPSGHGRREAASELRRHSRIAAHLLHRALTSARVSPCATP